ncbi:SDR family oxidoreductase [Salipaludibacillus sp. CUR1]|uniref:SDR family NAD(P)-dependent oxidoreductase n=1 Tax=Salipaludibacillus sp. CUR1 TaxID=2820003 RepID=UPI001E48E38E|nr:SDR family oxidoreductase [Salipaludibacillus sp. CUR1]MCE7792020.1 SDR family oxidoreductase [Salipaludibacillus sp. CUR1]
MTIFNREAFKGKHILITGATGGIGEELAYEAVKYGASLTLTGRNKEKLENIKNKCRLPDTDVNVLAVTADLTNEYDRKQLIDKAVNVQGSIDGLVNSAGITGGDTVEDLKENDLRLVMELNYTSTVMLTQLVYRHMKKRKSGAIVNLSSLSGLRGTYGNTAYSASKFAITGFTQSFALEAIEHNIRVNAVCPGFVDTAMAREIISKKADKAGRSYDEQLAVVNKGLPSGRITQPLEVANSILFLLSPAAENIVGESMKISGGTVMR